MSDLPFDRQVPARPRDELRPVARPQGVFARLSPDCAQGKHTACSGDAWDDEADAPAACECNCPHY
jgi:hypothetical protein